jgi:hypothetical protein
MAVTPQAVESRWFEWVLQFYRKVCIFEKKRGFGGAIWLVGQELGAELKCAAA